MALVNIDSLPRHVLLVLAGMEHPAGIELLSYKRNRSVSVAIEPGGQMTVREQGFAEQQCTVHQKELPRLLKTMIKREFPRSRKVRIHKFDTPDELTRTRKIL